VDQRSLALGVAAAGAFLLAFGIGKAIEHEAGGAPARPAVAIEPGGAAISADVTTGARLPGLKEPRPRPPRPRPRPARPQPTPGPAASPPARPPTRPLTPAQPPPMPPPRESRPDPDGSSEGDEVIGGGVN
jgi:hypothetical protein